ncbi:pyruvate kinase, partial [Trifolium medium]|nr:pyruvate kinase [Trifolium medium]
VETISGCLKAGMSVARFDFSWCDPEYHQETLENLKTAIKGTKKLCAVSFLPSLQSCRIIVAIAWPNFNKPILFCNMRKIRNAKGAESLLLQLPLTGYAGYGGCRDAGC